MNGNELLLTSVQMPDYKENIGKTGAGYVATGGD